MNTHCSRKPWPSLREGLSQMDRKELIGGVAGMLGNTLVSMPSVSMTGWGFILFLVSNFFLIQVFWRNRMPVLVVMTLWYSTWSLNGIINYWPWG